MRTLPEGVLSGQYGSLSDGRMEFTSWYDGRPVAPNIPVENWSQKFSGGTQVSGSTSVTVADPSGDLAPWGMDDPLSVGGALLQSRLILGPVSVPLGWQRITDSKPTEVWRRGPQGVEWVNGGAQIDVEAQDLTVVVAGNKFVSPESPLPGNTCVQEIRRLLLGMMDVTFEDSTGDISVPESLTYKEERLDAVEDLIIAMGCSYRVTGNGLLSVYKPKRESVWTIRGTDMLGSLIAVSRSLNIGSLKNLVVARNTLSGGEELQAAIEERSGPLRVDGPHGRWPEMVQADFAETAPDITRAAEASLQNLLHDRVVSIPLTTVFHPGLEVGDWVTVMYPMNTGDEIALEGRITQISYEGPGVPAAMRIDMDADMYAIQAVSEALRARRWNR